LYCIAVILRLTNSLLETANLTSNHCSSSEPVDAHCCHVGTEHSVPDWFKPSFVIFDIRALWRDQCLNR